MCYEVILKYLFFQATTSTTSSTTNTNITTSPTTTINSNTNSKSKHPTNIAKTFKYIWCLCCYSCCHRDSVNGSGENDNYDDDYVDRGAGDDNDNDVLFDSGINNTVSTSCSTNSYKKCSNKHCLQILYSFHQQQKQQQDIYASCLLSQNVQQSQYPISVHRPPTQQSQFPHHHHQHPIHSKSTSVYHHEKPAKYANVQSHQLQSSSTTSSTTSSSSSFPLNSCNITPNTSNTNDPSNTLLIPQNNTSSFTCDHTDDNSNPYHFPSNTNILPSVPPNRYPFQLNGSHM